MKKFLKLMANWILKIPKKCSPLKPEKRIQDINSNCWKKISFFVSNLPFGLIAFSLYHFCMCRENKKVNLKTMTCYHPTNLCAYNCGIIIFSWVPIRNDSFEWSFKVRAAEQHEEEIVWSVWKYGRCLRWLLTVCANHIIIFIFIASSR